LFKVQSMSSPVESELLTLTRQLLTAIADRDWKTYAELCDPSLTCFEPEAMGQLVEGMEFHKFYFDLPGSPGRLNTTLAAPHVRMMGPDAAVVSYIRLVQSAEGGGGPSTSAFDETRIWQRIGGAWKHVHFHRSATRTEG
jgi:Calcium/calmodulin dependent protein kinase II association domain